MLKKTILIVLVLAAIAVTGVYLGGGWLVERGTRHLLAKVTGTVIGGGVKIDRLEFAAAAVRPLANVQWSGWILEAERPADRLRADLEPLRARADRLRMSIVSWSPLTVNLRLDGIALDHGIDPEPALDGPFAATDYAVPVEKIDEGFLELPRVVVTRKPSLAVREIAAEVRALLGDGRTERDLHFGARMHFRLADEACSARLETERTAGVTWLRCNRADVEEIARRHAPPLTAGEQRIVCEFPLRAPLILRITDYAERLAKRLPTIDRTYAEKPSRHVVWSFWLTRAFGPDFAQRVTDAHEVGGEEESEAVHRQDLANNAVGRTYALAQKSEGQVLQLLKTDPQIVRIAR